MQRFYKCSVIKCSVIGAKRGAKRLQDDWELRAFEQMIFKNNPFPA